MRTTVVPQRCLVDRKPRFSRQRMGVRRCLRRCRCRAAPVAGTRRCKCVRQKWGSLSPWPSDNHAAPAALVSAQTLWKSPCPRCATVLVVSFGQQGRWGGKAVGTSCGQPESTSALVRRSGCRTPAPAATAIQCNRQSVQRCHRQMPCGSPPSHQGAPGAGRWGGRACAWPGRRLQAAAARGRVRQ